LVGINNSVVTDSYWDGHTTGMTASGVGNNTGTFTATEVNGDWNATPDAYNEATYADLDFSNGWFIAEGSSRPMLRGFLDGGNISNLYQLQGMAADLAGDYTLTQNIDASATASTDNADVWGGRGFAPVGVIGDEFTGSLNGGGFAITDLTINRADQMLVGLFGHMSGSITQLTFVNADITGNDMVGVLAGGTDGGSVDTVSVSGVINGQGAVGALVGINAGSIAKSYSTATVNGSQHVGGLVGINLLGVIEDSFATGAVTVTGANAGGLVGLNIGEINTSYASGLVTGTAGTQGGLIGENDAIGTVTNSAFDAFTSGQTDAIGADANAQTVSALSGDWANSPDAYNASSYTGFNFANTWFIADGSSRPMLRSFLSGSGEVHNLYDLQGMAADLTGSYTLMAGIDASDTASIDNADVWGGRGFAPVGNVTTAFNGSLNGNGFMINDLTINRADQNYVGLIGNAGAGSNLSNLKLFANVVGADQTGLLAGANAGTISNALIGGEVTGNNAVGGVVGLNEGTINTSMHVGFFSGQVKGDTRVGGLAGENTGTIQNSATQSTVVGLNAATQIGGLVGFNNGGQVVQSYTIGDATGNSEIGALVGDNTGALTNLFWEDSATADGVGNGDTSGASSLTFTEMTDIASFASWGNDIDAEGGTGAVWRIYDGQMIPLLRSQLTEIEVTAYDDHKVYDGAAYDGLHDINGSTGGGVRYGNSYAEFVAVFGEDDVPYDGFDSLESQRLEYVGDSQGAVNAGTYDITPSELMSGLEGFDIVYNDGVLTIAQAVVSVTVTVDDASKEYGNADPTFSWGVTSGSLGSGDSLTGSLSRAPGENVGNYAITGNVTGDLASSNYNVTLVDGVFTITPRAISVNIADLEKIYGNDDPSFTWTVTGGSLAAGDELSGTLTRVPGENVGSYAITGALEGDLASNNYTVSVDDGVLIITPRSLVISADDLAKIYGQDDPDLTWSQGGNLADGDTLTVTLSRTEGQDVGNYSITPEVSGDVLSDNYNLSINNGALQITPAALTVSADDIQSYWDLLPPFSATLDGLANGDTQEDVFGDSLVVNSNLTLPIPGDYILTPMATLASNNYNVTFSDGVLTLLSSNPGNGYGDGLTSTQLPAREALGREKRANIFEGRDLLDGALDEISLGVYQDGVRLPNELLASIGLPMPRAVLFANNSDKVDDMYVEMLQNFVAKLARFPEYNLLVEGHTSHTGPRLLNEKLARKRAMAVYNILVDLGIEPARLGTKGFSWTRPVADNNTLEGQALNRRTEIIPDKPNSDRDANSESAQ